MKTIKKLVHLIDWGTFAAILIWSAMTILFVVLYVRDLRAFEYTAFEGFGRWATLIVSVFSVVWVALALSFAKDLYLQIKWYWNSDEYWLHHG
jgi:hypothetical protein